MPKKRYYNNIEDSYKEFKNKYPEIDYTIYSTIVKKFLKFLVLKLLNLGEVKLPCRLGEVSIIGYKQKVKIDDKGNIRGLAPNWKETKILWEKDERAKKEKKLVYYFNEETEGTIYAYLWHKRNVNLANKNLYKLRFTRANKEALSTLVKQGKEYFIKN